MSKYINWRVLDKVSGQVFTTMAKDSIDAMEQVADMYDCDYDQLEIV